MKKLVYSIFTLVFTLLVMNTNDVAGQNRMQTREFLRRTHRVIEFAKQSVAEGKVYTGDVTKAVYHQRYARELFKEGKFDRAIHHSWRARELAHAAIRANKHEVARDMDFQESERGLARNRPE